MFSALSQGSLVHILDKTDGIKYKLGEVIGITQPNGIFGGQFGTSNFTQNSTVTIKLKIDGNVVEYPEVPSNSSVASYNNGCLIICETKQAIISEIETTLQSNKNIIDNISKYEKSIEDCTELLKQLNPQFAKDKERDDRIDGLNNKVTSMEDKLDKILDFIATNKTTNKI